jgi:endonuclease III
LKSRPNAKRIFTALERHHPNPDTELHYRTPFELLVATILSAQSSDERVNQVTPQLFSTYRDARAIARADTAALETLIKSTGFFRQKSKALIGMSQALVEHHAGQVPADMEALTKLPGVGRKTANVVLGHALGVPGLPVDRHVLRVANRIGLVRSEDPEKVEQALGALYSPKQWTQVSDLLILHGRRICRPTPKCEICNVRKDCDFFLSGGVVVRAGRAKRTAARPLRATGPTRPPSPIRPTSRTRSRPKK